MDHASLFRQLRQDSSLWRSLSAAKQCEEVGKWFAGRGWKTIGTGAFACVYRRAGEDQVIKVFPLGVGAGESTLAYLRSCRRGTNPMMPRVDGLTTVGRVGVAVMERLESTGGLLTVHAVAEDVGRYFRARSRNRRLNRDDLSEQAVRGEGRHFQVKDLSRLVSTLRTIRSQTPGSRLDLNQSNFMLRKTPQGKALVITDPLA